MAPEVIDKYQELETQQQELLAMHLAAMKVLDSTHGGGWGSFRVDGLSEEQAKRLPDYVGGYVGGLMPRLFLEEDGEPFVAGNVRVNSNHTKFSLSAIHEDDETGETRMIFKWNEELWNPEYAEALAKQEAKAARRQRIQRWAANTAIGALLVVGASSFGSMFYGIRQEADLRRQNAPQAEIDEARNLVDASMGIMFGSGLVAGTGAIVLLGIDAKKRPQIAAENQVS